MKTQWRTNVTKADTLFICWISKFITKAQIRRHILGTHNFVLLDATLGARQAHDMGMHLIFPSLVKVQEISLFIKLDAISIQLYQNWTPLQRPSCLYENAFYDYPYSYFIYT